ncbi:MAG: hypothetical protein F4W95_13415 [Chloroflexi bacterium]|nr:hypothetical protein [Chloroflexota bacterium]MYD49464.1 hypothetical protein [Chloroflexota bacterium]
MSDSIVVIQCAGSKQPNAGHLQSSDGRKVMFVSNPQLAPPSSDYNYARPDDLADTGRSWREELQRYNREPDDNPLGLLPAWRLYQNPAYELLYRKCGPDNLYILSAGWGLLRADFLTPTYDITFSGNAKKFQRRYQRDHYSDFRKLPDDTAKPVVFFGGKDYVGLFCELTSRVQGPRCVLYNANNAPKAPGCQTRRFHTYTRTNWHYEAARSFVDDKIGI